ncbi:hypothetical protein TIFTF001_029466 [Ficus carica]|uniref:Uncharacterized protein n=1 Tax=Ficus carica TaxID=3494 RepID=A0AA88DRN6_FICCA|nr:hypothetical protein TIFTF001_029466 [Ficus carica]
MDNPKIQALQLLREGLPPEVRQFVTAPRTGVTLETMIDAIMEVEIIAYILRAATPEDDCILIPVGDAGIGKPLFQEGPIWSKDPIPTASIQEIPPQEEETDLEEQEEWEDQEDDPEEILFDDGDWDAESDVFSDVTTE